MTTYHTIHTDIWQMSLPSDWTQREVSSGKSLYFEAADGTKGVYLTTWTLGEGDQRTAEDVSASFRQADLQSLMNMPGYAGQTISEVTRSTGLACVSITDCLVAEKNYRTVGKILVVSPLVVKASFHDYACSDYDASLNYFAPMIDSLQFFVEPA
jgi:hypothetical protein